MTFFGFRLKDNNFPSQKVYIGDWREFTPTRPDKESSASYDKVININFTKTFEPVAPKS